MVGHQSGAALVIDSLLQLGHPGGKFSDLGVDCVDLVPLNRARRRRVSRRHLHEVPTRRYGSDQSLVHEDLERIADRDRRDLEPFGEISKRCKAMP